MDKEIIVRLKEGLHMRPSAELCKLAIQNKNSIILDVFYKGKKINVYSVMNILFTNIKYNERVRIVCSGNNEAYIMKKIETILGGNDNEEMISVNQKNVSLTKVNIPYGTKRIEDDTYKGYINLKYVDIPNSVEYIGADSFEGTPFIEDFHDDFIVLGDGILYKYKGVSQEVRIPPYVKRIGPEAFSRNQRLKHVIIGEGVLEIGNYAFFENTNLERITFKTSVCKKIGFSAFSNCINLKSISMPSSIDEISECAFSRNQKMESIVIPRQVKYIGNCTFFQCVNLKKCIVAPDTIIEDYAFQECNSELVINRF